MSGRVEIWSTVAPPRVVRKGSWAELSSYRIHPEDEHLQYGPLSTAVRESVLYGVPERPCPEYSAAMCWFSQVFDFTGDYAMAKLVFAEFLADEGL